MTFEKRIVPHVDRELASSELAEADGDLERSFRHLERAHVLGQLSTAQHVRVHARMLAWAVRQRRPKECVGQALRIVGAATKTALGLVPEGNTGGANVSAVQRLPIPTDLAEILERARTGD